MHNELLHSRIRHSFQDHHIKWSTGASTPRLRYAGLFAKPLGTYQPSRANSTMGYKAGNWASSCSQRREDTVVGRILTLQQRRGWADLMTVFKIFTALLDVGPNLFFFPSHWPTGKIQERIGVFVNICHFAMLTDSVFVPYFSPLPS